MCLPVNAQEPASKLSSFEQQNFIDISDPKLAPLQTPKRTVLKGWVKENASEDGSNRTGFIADDEIQYVDEELSGYSGESKDFNNIVNEKPRLKKEPPLPETEKSTVLPDDAVNWYVWDSRKYIFKNVVYAKDTSIFPTNDPDYEINKIAMNKGLKKIENRLLTLYHNGTYAIIILTDELYNKAFYYSKNGELTQVVYFHYPKHIYNAKTLEKAWNKDLLYPNAKYFYNVSDGKLKGAGFGKSDICYVFNSDSTRNSFWVKDTGYKADGKVGITDKTIKY